MLDIFNQLFYKTYGFMVSRAVIIIPTCLILLVLLPYARNILFSFSSDYLKNSSEVESALLAILGFFFLFIPALIFNSMRKSNAPESFSYIFARLALFSITAFTLILFFDVFLEELKWALLGS